MTDPGRRGLSRRELLKRGAAGGVVIWATPVVQVIGMSPALAQETSPAGFPCTTITEITANINCVNLGGDERGLQFTLKTTYPDGCCGLAGGNITWTSKVTCGDCGTTESLTREFFHTTDCKGAGSFNTTTHTHPVADCPTCRIEATATVVNADGDILSVSSLCADVVGECVDGGDTGGLSVVPCP